MKIIYGCPYCQSTDIARDSSAEWDTKQQEWIVRSVYDTMSCDDCGEEFKEASETIVEETIDDAKIISDAVERATDAMALSIQKAVGQIDGGPAGLFFDDTEIIDTLNHIADRLLDHERLYMSPPEPPKPMITFSVEYFFVLNRPAGYAIVMRQNDEPHKIVMAIPFDHDADSASKMRTRDAVYQAASLMGHVVTVAS